MNCVSCEKCRLWGKLQTLGLGTALKILFSYGNNPAEYELSRNELVALINGLARLSESIMSLEKFIEIQHQEETVTPPKMKLNSQIILTLAVGFAIVTLAIMA